MSEALKRNAVRGVIKMMGIGTPESIQGLTAVAESYTKAVQLQGDETDVVGIIYLKNNQLMCAACTIAEDKQTGDVEHRRYLYVAPAHEVLTQVIENI